MVKLYLKNNKTSAGKDYVEIKYSSILKAYVLGWIGFSIIVFLLMTIAFLGGLLI